ncbi:hypothetical protein [Listeria booriae]|uniref:hypothetical protein n=1 Tax=Listeria booriae TaxID=1552123 RepID=UPI001624CDDA|nr:hypothetical protein [Listeria booriae]MBC1235201.1 hypothetical protein [Listeria booriae]
MLRINRVKVIISTSQQDLIFDELFSEGINVIRSGLNSSGKSSVISSIYYCLGFEEIIGGRGHKVLSSAFKTVINVGDNEVPVLESKIFVEVSNGVDDITLYRTAKMDKRKDGLISVYFSKMDDIHSVDTILEDMYVHRPNSATNSRGFHKFLQSFLNMELPMVPSSDNDTERKLYIQLVFSSMFIEQKRGWGDIFSGMPHLGISDSKKRVVEYLLDMSTLQNEKLKYQVRNSKKEIELQWGFYCDQLNKLGKSIEVKISGITTSPKILDDTNEIKAYVMYKDESIDIDSYIALIEKEYSKKPERSYAMSPQKIQQIQIEITEVEKDIIDLDENYKEAVSALNNEKISLDKLSRGLKLINEDIKNNKDAKKLVVLGSEENFDTFKNICPTCEQGISDNILISQNEKPVMTIDENIKHLESQRKLFELTIIQKEEVHGILTEKINRLQAGRENLEALAYSLRKDLYKIDGEISDSDVEKRVGLRSKIRAYKEFKKTLDNMKAAFVNLGKDWKKNLTLEATLPRDKFTNDDTEKLKALKRFFTDNLTSFGYRSVNNMGEVKISTETYLPVIDNFDMKFDSSASDHIRSIWAYTVALLQTSELFAGNHQSIIILDEPAQHSIILNDLGKLFSVLGSHSKKNQFIVGLTLGEAELIELLQENDVSLYNIIGIDEHAFM